MGLFGYTTMLTEVDFRTGVLYNLLSLILTMNEEAP